jgi:hypothetical protein
MVKRATFLQMFLVAVLFVIICAYGLAVAKDKLVLKYLPVDHDIEMVRQANNTTTNPPLRVHQTNSTVNDHIIRDHIACLKCREYDAKCPGCCVNNTLIYCQNATDSVCPNVGQMPFTVAGTGCPACVSCNNTFKRTPSVCTTGKCAKYPQPYVPCFAAGCPESTTGKCVNITVPPNYDSWICAQNGLKARKSCTSLNSWVPSCQNFTNATTAAYVTIPGTLPECTAAGLPFPCYIYNVTSAYNACIWTCNARVDIWEKSYYEYNNGTLGKKICPAGNCTSGFDQNCDAGICQKKIDQGCGNYTVANCTAYENDYREMLLGNNANTFVEIDPNFRYSFVARSGERYMISWQVLCDIIAGDQKYYLYTMVKVWDQEHQNIFAGDTPVYESIVHQKALGSTFYINAQTGMDAQRAPRLTPGSAYIIKLYYFLPNDGTTPLEVDISLMQMILYRTKN